MFARMMLAAGFWLAWSIGATALPAQDKKDEGDPSAPGPEHKVLEELTGSYGAKITAWTEPGKPPEVSNGLLKRKMLFGGRYLQEEFEGKLGPETFNGMSLIGFDKLKKRYVLAWIDSNSTGFMTSEGTYDAGKKLFTYISEDLDPATGKKMKGRDLLRIDSADQQTFEMYRQPLDEGAKEFKVLEIVYTRKR